MSLLRTLINRMLLRIVQEAVQNSIKNGDANDITINLYLDKQMKVSIADNGTGFDNHNNAHNIVDMKHRTKLLGGTIQWKSRQQNGTEVIISLSVQEQGV